MRQPATHHFGYALAALRARRSLSLRKAGQRIHCAETTLSRYEHEQIGMQIAFVDRCLAVYGAEWKDFLSMAGTLTGFPPGIVKGRPRQTTCKRGHLQRADNTRVTKRVIKGKTYTSRSCTECAGDLWLRIERERARRDPKPPVIAERRASK